MHADITSDKAGKCSKCGMNLVAKKAEAKKSFICPMHADVTSDKAGKCSKCGMNLVEKKLNKPILWFKKLLNWPCATNWL